MFNRKTEDFLLALGCGDINAQTVVNRVVEHLRELQSDEEDALPPPLPQLKSILDSDEITIQGAGGMLTRIASCCNPVKGRSDHRLCHAQSRRHHSSARLPRRGEHPRDRTFD